MSEKRRLLLNMIYLFIGTVVANIGGFIFRIVVARAYGPSGFGRFSLAMMVMTICTSVALFGFPDGIITYVSRYREKNNARKVMGVIVTSFSISLLLGGLLSAILYLLSPLVASVLTGESLVPLLQTLSLVIPAEVFLSLIAALFLAYERAELQVLFKEGLPRLGSVSVALLTIWIGGTLFSLVEAYVVMYACLVFVGLISLFYFLWKSQLVDMYAFKYPDFEHKKLIYFSFPLLLTGFIGLFLNWTDVLVLGYFLDDSSVGVYQSAFLLGSSVAIFQGFVAQSLYPNLGSIIGREDYELASARYMSAVQFTIIVSVPPIVYLFVFSEMSLRIIFGEGFGVGAASLSLLVAGQGLVAAMGPVTNTLKVLEQSKYIAFSYLVALVLNVGINIVLVPVFGIVGAAIGTTIGLVASNILHLWKVSKHLELSSPLKTGYLAVLCSAVALFPTIVIQEIVSSEAEFLLHITLFSTLYIVSAIASGMVTVREVRDIVSAVSS